MPDRTEPTPEQFKAVASPLRLRILRLCRDREWTNKELADRLDRDPATILHHLRLLLAAGLIEATPVRQGRSGAYEKPYRSTNRSWQLNFDRPAADEEDEGQLAMVTAFSQELAEAGDDSVAELDRFHLHLDADNLATFTARFVALVEDYRADDETSKQGGAPAYGGLLALHRLADPPTSES